MDYVTAVTHEVADLESARELFGKGLGFTLAEEGAGRMQFSNGSVTVSLLHRQEPATTLSLRLRCDDLEQTAGRLATYGVTVAGERFWADERCQEQHFDAPAGVSLTLFRAYSEDELGIEVALPVNLEWASQALMVTRALVKLIPLDFRDTAREKIVAAAEGDALVEGAMAVTLAQAMRAVIRVTPAFQHEGLRETMAKHGLNFDDYLP